MHQYRISRDHGNARRHHYSCCGGKDREASSTKRAVARYQRSTSGSIPSRKTLSTMASDIASRDIARASRWRNAPASGTWRRPILPSFSGSTTWKGCSNTLRVSTRVCFRCRGQQQNRRAEVRRARRTIGASMTGARIVWATKSREQTSTMTWTDYGSVLGYLVKTAIFLSSARWRYITEMEFTVRLDMLKTTHHWRGGCALATTKLVAADSIL